MPQIVVSITGGHSTNLHNTVFQIKNALMDAFVDTEVTTLDCDEMTTGGERTYSDKDYDFAGILNKLKSCGSSSKWEAVVVFGAYALFDAHINEMSQLKVFLDSDGDRRLIDLIQKTNSKTPDKLSMCIKQYMEHLRPEMQKYIEPTRAHADLIIPNSNESVGAAIIVDSIVKIVEENKGGISQRGARLFPRLDFQAERLDFEKEKFYDLS
ncbi:LAMI_0C06062g1_1 [Lachancea mirantina]|uniref:LAMI_0C06062g1_1 n=1 Tax=Lachancea mirantina TaxID=1230905 RepID=A0A1G4J352_9SACH|nr:LAMI_0C06062g1_1 [Lachancea mirantina]